MIDLPNGTIIRYRRKRYCLMYGLEGRILMNVNDGHWLFVRECAWKTYHIEHQPE